MKATVLLFVISLLGFCETREDHRVFVRRGGDLRLTLNTLPEHFSSADDFFWKLFKKDETLNIVKVRRDGSGSYEPRAELKENYSLLLRNLAHNESGTYKAVLSGRNDKTLAEYIVIVQDPVSPVNLTVSSNSNSSGCILNTSCLPEDFNTSITFTCNKKSCTPESEVNLLGSIVVFVQQDHIICNYSNQVSWKQDKVDISAYCGEDSDRPSGVPLAAIVLGTVFGVSVLLPILIYHFRKSGKRKNKEKTPSSVPPEMNQDQTPHQNSTEEAPTSFPESTYALVQFCPRPTESNAGENACKPESVYAVVNKANCPRAAAADEDE